MNILTIVLLAIGLAMDCFAVSVCKGLTSPHGYVPRYIKPILMALLFGVFHAGMPLIGYFAGSFFASFFERFAPWIALALLGFIGGKMIYDSLHDDDNEAHLADFSFVGLLSLHGISLVMSQILSNVPYTVLMLPLMESVNSETLWLALASASTLAGNATIIGAMANIIVIESADKYGVKIGFWEFFKSGIIITILSFILSMAVLLIIG